MNVGFVGLGRMGSGMAHRILGAGHDMVVFDAVAAQTEPFVKGGARAAASLADVCAGRESSSRCSSRTRSCSTWCRARAAFATRCQRARSTW